MDVGVLQKIDHTIRGENGESNDKPVVTLNVVVFATIEPGSALCVMVTEPDPVETPSELTVTTVLPLAGRLTVVEPARVPLAAYARIVVLTIDVEWLRTSTYASYPPPGDTKYQGDANVVSRTMTVAV
jgi:hypothetical protein